MTPELNGKIRAMLQAALLEEQIKWTCRWCGGRTTILSEICAKCGLGDCSQGTDEEL